MKCPNCKSDTKWKWWIMRKTSDGIIFKCPICGYEIKTKTVELMEWL